MFFFFHSLYFLHLFSLRSVPEHFGDCCFNKRAAPPLSTPQLHLSVSLTVEAFPLALRPMRVS